MRGEQEMYDLILGYAEKDPNVRGVILNGSRADPARRLDAFRDYDIVYLVTDVAPYKEGDISPAFGEVLVMQRTDESELYQEHYPRMACYLMQFADGSRIDLTIARVEDYRGYCFDDRLSMVLLDKDGFLPALPPPADVSYGVGRPSPRLFQECRNEFWWTAPYVSKGLWRGSCSTPSTYWRSAPGPCSALCWPGSWAESRASLCTRARPGTGWGSGCRRMCGGGTCPPTPPARRTPCSGPCWPPASSSPRPRNGRGRHWATAGRTTGTQLCPNL